MKTTVLKANSLFLKKSIYAAVCLALALVLPLLTGQLQQLGRALCPMHLPVLLCGFLCGWQWGLLTGMIAPLLRFAIFAMPPLMPEGVAMAAELAVYGAIAGLLYQKLPQKYPYLYVSLIAAMLLGRLAWGAVRFGIAGFDSTAFGFPAFFAGAVTTALPGIALQIALIPPIVFALKKAQRGNAAAE